MKCIECEKKAETMFRGTYFCMKCISDLSERRQKRREERDEFDILVAEENERLTTKYDNFC